MVKANWLDYMRPKYHWLVHLHQHLAKFQMLPTCWVHERKHKLVKRYAADIQNTSKYEQSVLSQVTCHDLASWRDEPSTFDVACALVSPKPMTATVRNICALANLELEVAGMSLFSSNAARLEPAGLCAKNDVVLISSNDKAIAGKVDIHVDVNGTIMSLVTLLNLVSYDKVKGTAMWEQSPQKVFVETSKLLSSVVFAQQEASRCRTIIPLRFKSLF